jgi:ATPase subunit of ABC transporter with duplicated ATPase domains
MLQFHNVSFTYPSAPSSLFTSLSLTFGKGWSGLVGPNGSGKTTLIGLAAGELQPDTGHVRHTGLLVCCPQRSEKPGDNERGLFDPFSWDSEKERLCRLLEIQPDWLDRWQTLSQGEQKRFQVAAVLAQKPDILLVDEPTNHLDMVSAEMIFAAFRSFEGIGVLISHDRRLLDDLCQRIVFIDPPDVLQFSGNYSQALEQKNGDEQNTVQHRENLKKSAARLESELRRRTEEADRSASRVSKSMWGATMPICAPKSIWQNLRAKTPQPVISPPRWASVSPACTRKSKTPGSRNATISTFASSVSAVRVTASQDCGGRHCRWARSGFSKCRK